MARRRPGSHTQNSTTPEPLICECTAQKGHRLVVVMGSSDGKTSTLDESAFQPLTGQLHPAPKPAKETRTTNPKTRSTPPDATIQALRWLRPYARTPRAQSWSAPKTLQSEERRGVSIRSGQEPGSPSSCVPWTSAAHWDTAAGCVLLVASPVGWLAGTGTGTSASSSLQLHAANIDTFREERVRYQ